jgi:hypothetical protein
MGNGEGVLFCRFERADNGGVGDFENNLDLNMGLCSICTIFGAGLRDRDYV